MVSTNVVGGIAIVMALILVYLYMQYSKSQTAVSGLNVDKATCAAALQAATDKLAEADFERVKQQAAASVSADRAVAATIQVQQAKVELDVLKAKIAAMPGMRDEPLMGSPDSRLGGSPFGQTTGLVYCPYKNDYIEKLNVASDGKYVTGIQAICAVPRADGTKYTSPWIGFHNTVTGMYDISGGSMSGRSGAGIDKLGSVGGEGGNPWSFACPTGKISAIDATKGPNYLINIKPYCSDMR